jgi:hypothetical protein
MQLRTASVLISLFATGIFLTGCDVLNERSNSISDNQFIQLDKDELVFQLSVEPAQINLDEEITAIYSIRNNRSETVEMMSSCFVIARGVVFKNDQEIGLQGSSSGCYTGISTHEIDPGGELEMEWQVKPFSVRFFPDNREPETTFAEPGEYTFTVIPDVFEVNGEEASLPEIETTFEIE